MKKYYLMAIENDKSEKYSQSAIINLAKYYENIEINNDLMKKYYLMIND